MEFCVDPEDLRKALADVEEAEKNGFMYCVAVFRIDGVGRMLQDCCACYSDLWEKAHPTDGRLNWGRHQNVSKRNRFEDGKLVLIEEDKEVNHGEGS